MKPTIPTIALFAYFVLVSLIKGVYAEYALSLPPVFEFLEPFGLLGLLCWWLESDSRKNNITWPLDLGMHLYVAWFIVLPFHLIKTRGIRALLDVLVFAGACMLAWVILAVVVSLVLQPI